MESNFSKCMDFVFPHEGGFTDDPADPGGPTNFGITQRTLAAWRHADVSTEDVRDLTKDEAQNIYHANFWNPIRGQDLPGGVDLVTLDIAVMSGTRAAATMLQRAAGLTGANVDGAIGTQTLKQVGTNEAADLLDKLSAQREAFYQGIVHSRPTSAKFLKGWLNRVHDAQAAGRKLIAKT